MVCYEHVNKKRIPPYVKKSSTHENACELLTTDVKMLPVISVSE